MIVTVVPTIWLKPMNTMAGLAPDTTPANAANAASFAIMKGKEKTLIQVDGTNISDDLPDNALADQKTDKAFAGRVTIDATSVLVDLSNEWRAGGEVVVVLRNVQTAVPRSLSQRPEDGAPYHSYPVTVKSKRSGHLDLLDPVEIDHDGVDGSRH